MKLPKPSLKKSKKEEKNDNDFLVLDLAQASSKSVCFTKKGEHLIAKGLSIKSTDQLKITKDLIAETLSEAQAQAGSKTDNLIIGLSGSKVIGFVIIAQYTREKPDREVNEKEVEKIHERIAESAYQQVKNRWSILYADDLDFELLDLVITSTLIDGERVEDMIGNTGEKIQVSVFCSYSVKSYYDWVLNTVKKLKYNVETITTTLYSQSKLLNNESKNYLLVDIGKKTTDVAIILGENIIQTRSFELGGDFFSKWLAEELGVEANVADARKEAYASKTLDENEMDRVGDILYEAGVMWRKGVQTALTSMSGIKSFPSRIYVSGGCANLPVVQELLHEDAWKQAIPFANNVIEIETTNSGLFSQQVSDELQLLNGPQWFVPVSIGLVRLELDE